MNPGHCFSTINFEQAQTKAKAASQRMRKRVQLNKSAIYHRQDCDLHQTTARGKKASRYPLFASRFHQDRCKLLSTIELRRELRSSAQNQVRRLKVTFNIVPMPLDGVSIATLARWERAISRTIGKPRPLPCSPVPRTR